MPTAPKSRRKPGWQAVAAAIAAVVFACSDDDAPLAPTPDARAVAISISPDSVSFPSIGDTATFTAKLTDQNGAEFNGTVSWSSDGTHIFTVNAGGGVTSAGNGAATVRATHEQLTATARVAVRQVADTVMVSPGLDSLFAIGDTARFNARAADANGHAVEGAAFSWVSNHPAVATVDSMGLAMARGLGSAEITATVSGVAGTAALLVLEPLVLSISPDSTALAALGDTVRLVAEADGDTVSGPVAWTSGDSAVATVDASGLVRATGEGRSTITAAVGASSATAVVTVSLRLDADSDRRALVAFHRAAGGVGWVRDGNWLTDAPLDDWEGVTTDAEGRVTHLVLRANGGAGSLPIELGNLSRLVVLDLNRNKLAGPLPRQLGYATRLERIDLGHNQLNGPIPAALGRLRGLRELILEAMLLSGPIPPEIGSLGELRILNLWRNTLTGSPPPQLARLRKLEILYIDDNRLSGVIPSALTDLGGLSRFHWSTNHGLCAPATRDFLAWLRRLEGFEGPSCDEEDRAVLGVLYEAMNGRNWRRNHGWLNPDLPLFDWEGVGTDSVGRVEALDLADNGLAGGLASVLAHLNGLRVLRLGGNASLAGRVPMQLAALPLREFRYRDTGLCVSGLPSFQAWLASIDVHEGTDEECPELTERDILRILYEETGGANWTRSYNWLTDRPLRTWHGIEVDDRGRVRGVLLEGNNLRGSIPPELGQLEGLIGLQLDYNWLAGSIPPQLGDLPVLEDLVLVANLLDGPVPTELANLSKLKFLELSDNRLEGAIPPELGRMRSLENLYLDVNRLEGQIPAELGDLPNLTFLKLHDNQLEGPIPPVLGDLARLRRLILPRNRLSGPIPPELGNLDRLEDLELNNNLLSGPIPAELGSLERLWRLNLGRNALSGPIPPELGDLESLEELSLGFTGLEGPLPPEIARLSRLTWLDLSNTPGLAGPLPLELADLNRLVLGLRGTGFCIPEELVEWSLGRARAPRCEAVEGTAAYLTQAVQSLEYPVALVGGEEALLRVFIVAREETDATRPAVRATFFADGAEIHSVNIPGKATSIPTDVAAAEAELARSVNAPIPGEVVRPGLEMVVEIDPDGTLDSIPGVPRRIPETGRQKVFVRSMPAFNLTVVPFLWRSNPDSLVVDLAAEMAADPGNHRLLWDLNYLMPVGELAVRAHEPVLTSSNDGDELLDAVGVIRAMEGGAGHWMGSISGPATGPWGVAWIGDWTSYVRLGIVDPAEEALTIAHELGHNMDLWHAPCGTGTVLDDAYPFPDGSTGAWGIDPRSGVASLVPGTQSDLMSYCVPAWIGDYNFSKAMHHRLATEAGAGAQAASSRTILLWGGADADGVPFLNPAFAVDAPPALPEAGGGWRITGRGSDGAALFSLDFDMATVAHGEGRRGFVFAVPFRPEWDDALAEITLAGPTGDATIDRNTNRPAVIVRDRITGQVRAVLRNTTAASAAAASDAAVLPGMDRIEVLTSTGIPDAAAWRR